jgi:hypothetical protein
VYIPEDTTFCSGYIDFGSDNDFDIDVVKLDGVYVYRDV